MGERQVRYRMADGSLVYDEYAYVADLDYFDGSDDPVDLIRETVEVVASERVRYWPSGCVVLCEACHGEGDIDLVDCSRCHGSGVEPEPDENPAPVLAEEARP